MQSQIVKINRYHKWKYIHSFFLFFSPNILNEDPSSQNKKISEVYVFEPKNTTLQMCKTDVAIKPSNVEIGNKEICVKIEKRYQYASVIYPLL